MNQRNQKGFLLITSVLILTALLFAGSYLVAVTNAEHKISNAQLVATKNYYLAEAGINEMIWKIRNNSATTQAFLSGNLTSSSDINRTSVFGDGNASYQVKAISTATAEAQIIATSTYQIADNLSRRVVKAYVARATGSDNQWGFVTFAGGRGSQQNGNFTFTGSGVVLTANGGRLHANQVFKVQGATVVVNNGAVTASNVINVVAGGVLTLNNSYQDAPTTTLDMLQIDFNSTNENSWKNRATVTYTPTQFQNLANNTTLNGIIYVTGDADVVGKNMTINGVLVAEDKIDLSLTGKTFTVNADPTYGGGLLAKGEVDITTSGGTVLINGLIYAAEDLDISSAGTNFVINGSLTAFDAKVTASSGGITLNYMPENFSAVINPDINQSSPLIQINHWEEQY